MIRDFARSGTENKTNLLNYVCTIYYNKQLGYVTVKRN